VSLKTSLEILAGGSVMSYVYLTFINPIKVF
jgi:hypothetical protein